MKPLKFALKGFSFIINSMLNKILPVFCCLALNSGWAQTDTLISFFNPMGETLIESPNGGFLSGSNGFQDSEKLQSFFPSGNYSILGLLVWNGYVVNNSQDTTSVVSFKIRDLDTTATSTFPFFRGPGETIDSVNIRIENLEESSSFENGLNYVAFNSPVLVTSPYLAGFNLDGLYRNEAGEVIDSFAVRSTAIDSAQLAGFSWEKWNGVYKRIIDSWGVDVDFAIFPVIDTNLDKLSNLKMNSLTAYPNPCKDYVTVLLEENGKYESALLVNMNGQIVGQYDIDGISGDYTISLPDLSSGLYTIRLIGKMNYAVSPIIIE